MPFPSPEDLPDPGIEPKSPTLQADALTSEPPGKPYIYVYIPFQHLHFTEDPRLREVDGLALGHTAMAWQGWNLKPRSLAQVLHP